MVDLLIKNGIVIDPATKAAKKQTVAVKNGRIVDTGSADADYVIDADGTFVIPGLIDFHAHVFQGGSGFGVKPDWLLSTGVTTVVDAGSTGCANYEAFYRSVSAVSTVRVKAQLNLYPAGQPAYGIIEDYSPKMINRLAMQDLFRRYPQDLIGLKLRLGEEVVGKLGIQPLIDALELADEMDLPLVVHVSNPPCPEAEIAKRLRPGDVFCHCFHGKGKTILDENDQVDSEVWKAKERGVIFDSCNGLTNFCTDVARKALKQGFYPDIISTDEAPNVFNKNGFAKNLPYIMSKYLALGMDLEQIVKAVTWTPAQMLGMEKEIGSLQTGMCADIAIFKLVDAKPVFRDNRKGLLSGDKLLIPQMTIRNGQILYCRTEFPEN